MKHPALTRVFAIVLAVFSLVALLAGSMGLGRAASDHRKKMGEAERLRAKAADYEQALGALEGTVSYKEVSDELDSRQEEHDEAAAQHRIDLATYTATQGGLAQGVEALDEADAALAEGRAQYEAGLAAFEEQAAAFQEQYDAFQAGKAELASRSEQVNALAALVSSSSEQLDALQASPLPELPAQEEVDPEQARNALLAAYDQSLAALDQAPALLDQVKEQGGIPADQVQSIISAIEDATGQSFGITAQDITPEMLDQIDIEGTRQQVEDQRAAVANMSDEEVMAQYEQLREQYENNRGSIEAAIAAAAETLARYNAQLAEAQAQLSEAQAQMAMAEELLEQGKAGIEQGRAALEEAGRQIEAGGYALYDARTQIWYEMGKQQDKEETLRRERDALEEESEELANMSDKAAEQKRLEQRERSLRLQLMDREEIAHQVEAGEPLPDAAQRLIEELETDAKREYDGRRAAYWLMIVGGVCGFAAIPAAFERIRSRVMLLVPVALCMACAAAAELICLRLGRGNSYSALAAAGFALIQLLISAPKKIV